MIFDFLSNSRRAVVAMIFAAAALQSVNAVPVDPQPKKMRQADGSFITVCMHGDEYSHRLSTTDGYTLVYNRQTGNFEYAIERNGQMVTSGMVARDIAQRTAADQQWLSMMKGAISAVSVPRKGMAREKATDHLRNEFPTTGSPHTLVILLSFSDLDFESVPDAHAYFDGLLNEQGFTWPTGANGSVRDYFVKNSMGVFSPVFDVKGPVKLSKPHTYYGSDEGRQDNHIGEAIQEACLALDSEIDFSQYDYNGNGEVDNIYFFYAGNGQADTPNGDDLIWPHSADLGVYGKINLVLDGVRIATYACSNEVRYSTIGENNPSGIGTFTHEFTHVLGLMDHYDVSYNPLGFGPGSWDLMAKGAYNNDMHTPPLLSAFQRAELGWLEYEDLSTSVDSINVLPPLGESNKAYRVKVNGNDDEWYVMENRQQAGWDKYIPGHGMLTWHIDYDADAWASNTLNVNMAHQHVDIIEVDGASNDATRGGDVMPGTASVTSYDFKSWDGNILYSVANVVEKTDTIHMLLANTAFALPAPKGLAVSEVADSSFHIAWNDVFMANSYQLSVYTHDDSGNRSYVGNYNHKVYPKAQSLKIDGLTPATPYYIEVTAHVGSYASEVAQTTVNTQQLAFYKMIPSGLTASDITTSSFTASWVPVAGAADYELQLYRYDWGTDLNTRSYDFTNKYDGMPDMWSTSSNTYYSVSGYYGQAAPSLRFSNNGDWITMAYDDMQIESLSFWYRSKNATGAFIIETNDGNQWTLFGEYPISTTKASTFSVYNLGGAKQVRVKYNRTDGYVVIDDVTVNGEVKERSLQGGALMTDGQTTHRFESLASGQYAYTVTAINADGVRSNPSSEYRVVLDGEASGELRSIVLGYSQGEVAATTDIYVDGKTWTHGAVRLPSSMLSAYNGSAITHVRAALVSKLNIDSVVVWVKSSLEAQPMSADTITKYTDTKIDKGWNEVPLSHPVNITEGIGDLYIGYSVHQRGTVYYVSMTGNPIDETSYVWLTAAKGWQDYSDKGVLGVEAIAEGTTIPAKDLGLVAAAARPQPSLGTDGMLIKATVRNNGTDAISSFQLQAESSSGAVMSHDFTADLPSGSSMNVEWAAATGADIDDQDTWTVCISSVDGKESDDITANNSLEVALGYVRNVIVEEFTTEKCVNCPRAAVYLHEALADKDCGGNIVAVCRHAGYYTDSFTKSCDNDYLVFYNNNGSTYAPGMMVDRRCVPTTKSPVFNPTSSAEILYYVAEEIKRGADVMLDIQPVLADDGSTVTITVNGVKASRYTTEGKRLCVVIVEDDVKSVDQIGGDANYRHQYVNRGYNSTWGEEVTWNGNGFAHTVTLPIPSACNVSNMQAVAYIGNYDSADPLECVVDNAAKVDLLPKASAVDGISNNDYIRMEACYDLNGRRCSTILRGIQLHRMSDGTVRKVFRK